MKTILLLFTVLALPAMGQKKLWEVEVDMPTQQAVAGEVCIEQLNVDAVGHAMMRVTLKNGDDRFSVVYSRVIWVSNKGVMLNTETFSYYTDETPKFSFMFQGSSRAMIYSSIGTGFAWPTGQVASEVVMTFTRGKSGLTKTADWSPTGGMQLNEAPQGRMAAYAKATYHAETKKVKVDLWRAW